MRHFQLRIYTIINAARNRILDPWCILLYLSTMKLKKCYFHILVNIFLSMLPKVFFGKFTGHLEFNYLKKYIFWVEIPIEKKEFICYKQSFYH